MNVAALHSGRFKAGQAVAPAGHRASRRSLASSRSGLMRCRRPKLLSGLSVLPFCDLNTGGGEHWEQAVLCLARRARRAGRVRRVLRVSVKVSAVVLHAKVADALDSSVRRQRAKSPAGRVRGTEMTRAVLQAPSRMVFLPVDASTLAGAYR